MEKLIKLKDCERMMSFEQVFEQFKRYLYDRVRHWSMQLPPDEVYSLASFGLWKAYKTYDVNKNILFMTYCARIIENEILMYNRKMKKEQNVISLNSKMVAPDESETELIEFIADGTDYANVAINNVEQHNELQKALNTLKPRDREIFERYYGEEQTQKDIAGKLGISQSYVSRLVFKKIPQKLKKTLKLKKGELLENGTTNIINGLALGNKGEQEETGNHFKSECKIVTTLTSEQRQIYNSMTYEDGKKYLEEIIKGENIMPFNKEPKITQEQLLNECRQLGTGIQAQKVIAEKYGLKLGTVGNYLTVMGIIKQIKAEKMTVSQETEPKTEITPNDVHAEDVPTDAPVIEPEKASEVEKPIIQSVETEQSVKISEPKKLKVISQVLQGEHFTFKVDEDWVWVTAQDGETLEKPLYFGKQSIRPFLEEFGEIAAVMGV
jgi:RNA polymerase sporulation-specific sigma factor